MAKSFKDYPCELPNLSDAKNKYDETFKYQYNLVNDKVIEVKTVVVHRFLMGDVEDPDLYAAEPMWKWQQSEQGAWVMEHAVESPVWHRQADPYNYGYQYAISAKLTTKDLTYFYLKWGNNIDNRTT